MEREAGDCEDYAIAKFFTFKRLYKLEDDISLMFCKKVDGGQNHMVLVHMYKGNRCVLDNEIPHIRTVLERTDILGIFSFNSTQVFLEKDGLAVPLKQGINKVKKWQTILQKTKLI